MSNTVDNRIVQLEMNNSQFERNAKKSTATLHELDDALNLKNGKKSFEEIEKAAAKVNFEPLMKAAQTVTTYVSNIGVASTAMITNITNRIVDGAVKITKSLSTDQIFSGYNKYEQKTANVQTLVNATGKSVKDINGYLSRLMWFSDETSYGFTDMTQALSTMVTSGGDIEKLIPMIEGMANATAFAGKGASEFNRVIYNLNQSYSQGFLSYNDWKSVQLAGASSKQLIETLIQAGEEAGTIKKGEVTVDNFANTLSKKWATRDVMESGFAYFDEMTEKAYQMIGALDESGNKIETASQAYEILSKKYKGVSINAAKAAQEAKSVTEAIDSTKDAVSSGWMRTFELIFGDYNQAKVLWTDMANGLWSIFASGFESRNDFLEQVFQKTPVENLMAEVEAAGVSFERFKKIALDTGAQFGEEITDTMRATQDMGELLQLTSKWLNGKNLSQVIRKASGDLSISAAVATDAVIDVRSLINDINSGKYGYGLEQQAKQLSDAGFGDLSAWDIQLWYNAVGGNIEENINAINDSLNKVQKSKVKITEEDEIQLQKIKENKTVLDKLADAAAELDNSYYSQNTSRTILIDALKNALGAVSDRIDIIRDSWKNAFPNATVEQVKNLVVIFHRLTESMGLTEEQSTKLKNRFDRLLGTARKISTIFGDLFDIMGASLGVGKRFAEWFVKIPKVAGFIESAKTRIDELFGKANDGLTNAHTWLGRIIEYLNSLNDEDFDNLLVKFQPVIDVFSKIVSGGKKAFNYLADAAINFWSIAKPMLSAGGAWLSTIGGYIYSNLIAPFGEFVALVINSDDPVQTLINGFQQIGTKVRTVRKNISGFFKDLASGKVKVENVFPGWSRIKETLRPVTEVLISVRDRAKEAVAALDFSDAVKILAGVGLFYGLSKLSKAITNIGNLATTVQATFTNINNIIRSKFTNNIATNLKAVATAIIAIAMAFKIMADIPVENLKKAGIALGALLLIMGTLAGVMTFAANKLGKDGSANLVAMAPIIFAFAAALFLLGNAVKNVSAAISGTGNMWEQVGGILVTVAGLGGILVAMAGLMTLIGGKITVAALAIILVSFALNQLMNALGTLGQINLTKEMETLLGIMVVVGLLSAVIGALGKIGGSATSITASVRNIAVSIAAIVAAAYLLQQLVSNLNETDPTSWSSIVHVMHGMTGLIIAIGAFVIALGFAGAIFEVNTKSILALSIGVFAMVFAMNVLQKLFREIAKMSSTEVQNASMGIVAIGICIAGILAFLGLASKLSAGGKGMLKISFGVLGIIAGMYVMLDLFRTIAKVSNFMSDTEIANGVAGIFGFTIMMCALLTSAGAVSNNGIGSVMSIVAVIAGILAIMYAIEKLSAHTWDELWPALVTVVGVMAGLSLVLFAVSRIVNQSKSVKPAAATKSIWPLIGLVLIIGEFVTAFYVLRNVPWQSMLITAGMIVGTFAVLYGVFAVIGHFNGNVSWAPIMAMATVIGTIVLAFYFLQSISWGGLLTAAISLGIVIAALGTALNIGGKYKVNASAIVGMTAVAMLAATSIYMLAKYPWQALLAGVLAFVATTGVLVGALALISAIQVNWGSIAAFAAIAGVTAVAFLAIAGALKLVENIDFDKIWKVVAVIGGLIAVMTIVAAVAAALLSPIIGVRTILLSLAGVILAFGASFMLAGIGIGIAAAGIGIAINFVATAFATFIEVIKGLQGYDLSPIAEGLISLAGAVVSLGVAFMVAGLGALGMVAVAAGMIALGLAAEASADGVRLLMVGLVGFMNILGAIGSAWEGSGGNLITALGNLRDEFGKSAEATVEFGNTIEEVLSGGILTKLVDSGKNAGSELTDGMAEGVENGTGDVKAAADTAVETMSDSAAKASKEGGKQTGKNFLDGISEYLSNVDMSGIGEKVGGFFGNLTDSFTLSFNNGNSNVAQSVAGYKKFADKLGTNKAPEMVAFSETIDNNEQLLQSAEKQETRLDGILSKGKDLLSEQFPDMSNMLKNSGSDSSMLESMMSGNVDYSSLGEGFSTEELMAAAETGGSKVVGSYAGSIKANAEPVKAAAVAITEQAFGEENPRLVSTAETIGNKLQNTVKNSIINIDWGSLSSLLENNLVTKISNAFNGSQVTSGMQASVQAAIDQSVDGVNCEKSASSMANSWASNFGNNLMSWSNTSYVKAKADELGKQAVNGLTVDTTESGQNFATGFGNGMIEMLDWVIAQATNLGSSAIQALNAACDEHSPSKLTAQSGRYFAEGFGNGIEDISPYAISMAARMGMRAYDALEYSIQNGNEGGIVPVLDMSTVYGQLLNFDGIYRPVIKPTLDLSEVNPGLRNVNAITASNARSAAAVAKQATTVLPTSVNFTQNNYSPKALSRVEIYRQTRNQINSIKGKVRL